MSNLTTLPTFARGDCFHVVVECPRGSAVKFKFDEKLGVMSVVRPLALGLHYPYDWGFVPSTRGPDGDPVDALVLWDVSSYPGVVLPCRALAVVRVEQNRPGRSGERMSNDRVIAVPEADRRGAIDSFTDLPQRVRDEIDHFVVAATVFEEKDPSVLGWAGADAALRLIRSSVVKRGAARRTASRPKPRSRRRR